MPLARLSRFVAGGALATLVHGAVLACLVEFLGFGPVGSNVPAFIVAFAVSYFFHYYITFTASAPHGRALSRYLLVALLGLATSTFVLMLAVDVVGIHYGFGFIAASGLAALQTYWLTQRWAFAANPAGRQASLAARQGPKPWIFPFVCAALCIASFYPGYLSFDSAYQYWQARTGHYSNLSPVVMTYFWAGLGRVWPGSGGILVLHFMMFWAGIALAVNLLFAARKSRNIALVLVGFLSPACFIVAHIWTDAALLSCLTLATSLVLYSRLAGKPWPLAAALLLFAYAGAVRHNAIPALLPLLFFWALVAVRGNGLAGRKRYWQAVFLALFSLACIGGATRLADRKLVVERVSTLAVVLLWDLASISLATDQMLIPNFARDSRLDIDLLRPLYSRYTNVPLYASGLIRNGLGASAYSDEEMAVLMRTWLNAVVDHPAAYARHRWQLTSALFGRYRNDRPASLSYVPTVVQYKDNPPIANNRTVFNSTVKKWYERSVGWWIAAPVSYLLLAALAIAASRKKWRTPAGQYVLVMALSGLCYVFPLAIVAPAAELRYSGWLFISSLLAGAGVFSLYTARKDASPLAEASITIAPAHS